MKSSEMKKATKRILAMLLCTSMVLSSGVSASADEGMAAVKEQGHVHTETCYEKNKTDNLICTKAEAAEGHVHGDECYEVTSSQELTCTQAETEGHTHGDSCMETTKNLICGKEEHTHGGDCYKTETRDVCSDESEEHTCGDGCVETEDVLTCTAEEHTHDDGCYEVKTNIVCGQDEVEAHSHGEGCYTTVENKTLKCTLEEAEVHTHNDDCYAWEDKLVCTIEETKPAQTAENGNTQEPVEEQSTKETEVKEEPTEVNLQNDDETGIKVSVKSTSDVIPEDTKVVVAPMEMDEEHETALAEAVSEFEVLGYTAYDISLKDAEDEDITLGENKVEVAIDLEEVFPEGINAEEVKDVVLVHITTDEEDKLTAETVGTVEITEEKATVEFEADSFSPYVVTYLSEAEETVEEVVVEEPVVEDITLIYTSEDEAYTVTVTGTPEVLENVTAFEAVPVTDEGKITALTEQLTAKAAEAQKISLGFENYEFKFLDAEGNEAAVNGEVKVSLSFAEERIPEAATAENVDAVDAALLKTGTDDKGEAVLEEINGLVSAEAGAVKEVVYTTEAPEELILAWSGDVYRTLPNYEDDEVVITLAGTEYALQNVVGFNVTPIKEDNEETKEQYAEVAQQLEEKIAEENEAKEVVGFLAYDITLVDAEGNELEPQGGVRVSMEYKEAAAPEAVAETPEAEVTIHHFEEDEVGEVKQIVDMVAEETVEATVEVTKAAEVEKVEFVTGSFSIYTVTWTYNSTYIVTLESHYGYLNDNGEFVEFTTEPGDKLGNISANRNDSTVNLAEYTNQKVFETGDYTYDKAYIVEGDAAYSNVISTTQLRLHYDRLTGVILQYRESGNRYTDLFTVTNTTSNNKVSIYYVYKTPPKPIKTVNSKSEYINIHVSDYSIWSKSQKSWDHTVQYDINDGHSLKFVITGNELSSPDYNVFTGGSIPRQGFIKKNLGDGYPQLGSESLAYLFNSGYDANYLFKKVDGYYIYDSAQNFASLDTATGKFSVYSEPNAGFFPFNEFTENLKIESANTSTVENHHSGMHVDFTFMQPKDGKTADNADMIFEFSGDDDVWVFIDDVLILDLGGIHQPTGGTINFATGEVTYTNATDTTIYNMYVAALKEKGMTDPQAETQAKTHFVEYETGKYRFKDYSQHDLNFFYLERGAHDSNCMIKFNLLSIPENSVFIEKKITKSNMADFADAEFKFKIEKKDVNTNGTYPTESTILANTTYKLYETDSSGNRTFIETRTTNANGEFVLKHRQVAEFSNIPASTKYCVTEVGVTSEVYDNVTLNGSEIKVKSTETEGGLTKHDYVTGDLLAQDHVYVTFENQCNVSNLRNLIVRKKMAAGQTSTENFDIKLEFAEDESWIPYIGSYYLGSSTGDKMLTSNGIITLKPGQEAHVIGLISDTKYRVTEILSEGQQSNYGDPDYSGTGTVETIGNVTYITDIIELSSSKDYMAIVTNSLRMAVNVEKVWVDSENTHGSVYVGLYKQDGECWIPYSSNSYKELKENAWSATFTGLDGGVYDVKELVPVISEDDASDFIINGTGYVATNEYYTNGAYDYAVSYDREIVQDITNVTITNTRLGKILIEKVSKSDHDLKLQGAEFKLQKYDATQNIYVDIKTGVTDRTGTVTFEKLENGTYQIVEIKAPAGYALSDDHKIVELPQTKGAVVTYEANVIIENEALYELPSTGGHGIFTTMLSGFALMLGAAYVWFKGRREESSNN